MSYEGYDQVLCENGHYFIYDCYDFWQKEGWECPKCGAKVAWSNMVDVTNGSFDEDGTRIDGYVELHHKCQSICTQCGSILEETYRIPTEEEMKKAKPWKYD